MSFEGSYLGANDRISPQAIMECKVCWTPYDPAEGDDFRQVDPGTAFFDLPHDWSCPNCSAPRDQFMVLEDPGAPAAREAEMIREATERLVADFSEVYHAKMRDVPIVNKLLQVEAVGFQMHDGRILGVLISPWFMNLVMMPGEGEDWSALKPGEKEVIAFPSGDYEFLHNTREMTGGYKACSLFSPMNDFTSKKDARDVAAEVMRALFDEGNRADTDRSADIRAAREEHLAALAAAEEARAAEEPQAEEAGLAPRPTRRALLTAGLATDALTPHDDTEEAEA